MNDREYVLRLAKRVGVKPNDPELRAFAGGCLRGAVTLDEAAGAWRAKVEAEETARRRPGGGLGPWSCAWVDCTRCRLRKYRSRVVFGRGSLPADVLLIGEAPGAVEDETGEPFRGPAGELLERPLRTITDRGLSFYVLNLLGCKPPNNRDPEADEVEACRPRLDASIRDVQPWVVVLLGAQPTRRLLDRRLTAVRGEVLKWDRHGGIATIPTWHPAGILRTRDAARMRELRADISHAAELASVLRGVLF